MQSTVLLIVIIILVAFLWNKRVERLETINSTFHDSMKDRAADYYYDTKGMTLLDYGLEQKMAGFVGV